MNNQEKIDSFLELKKNWDGYDGSSFTKDTIEKSKQIVELLSQPFHISPTGRGTIQIEWENDYSYFEIEISEDDIKAFFADERNKGT